MIEQNSRQTKVIKSFEGPALVIVDNANLFDQEVDVFRLVYSKDKVGEISNFIQAVKKQQTRIPHPSIMLDISNWIQASIDSVEEGRALNFGETVTASPEGKGGDIQIKSKIWDKLFKKGSRVYLGNGIIALKVDAVTKDKVTLIVEQPGQVYKGMDVIIPDTRDESLREAVELKDLTALLNLGVEYLIVPGVWSPEVVNKFKAELVKTYGDRSPWLFAKIDSEIAHKNLHDVIGVTDGVLISRREMSLSLNPATIPMITKEIFQEAIDNATVVVTASEMLASMRHNVTPTRAEVSDAANAVLDGTDSVVISEEVANGRFGSEAVEVMHRIIKDIESKRHSIGLNWVRSTPVVANEMDAIAYQAYKTAERLKSKAIVCITVSGNTALKLASFRGNIPVIAATFSEAVQRRLAIVRGVESLLIENDPNLDDVLPQVNDRLVRGSWLKPGDSIIFVSITLSSVGRESSNLFTVQTLN
jgi:pyruvate kinase